MQLGTELSTGSTGSPVSTVRFHLGSTSGEEAEEVKSEKGEEAEELLEVRVVTNAVAKSLFSEAAPRAIMTPRAIGEEKAKKGCVACFVNNRKVRICFIGSIGMLLGGATSAVAYTIYNSVIVTVAGFVFSGACMITPMIECCIPLNEKEKLGKNAGKLKREVDELAKENDEAKANNQELKRTISEQNERLTNFERSVGDYMTSVILEVSKIGTDAGTIEGVNAKLQEFIEQLNSLRNASEGSFKNLQLLIKKRENQPSHVAKDVVRAVKVADKDIEQLEAILKGCKIDEEKRGELSQLFNGILGKCEELKGNNQKIGSECKAINKELSRVKSNLEVSIALRERQKSKLQDLADNEKKLLEQIQTCYQLLNEQKKTMDSLERQLGNNRV